MRITKKLVKTGNVLKDNLKRIKRAEKLCSLTGWFDDQGYHLQDPKQPTYPELAQIHADGWGVTKRDFFSIAEFTHPLESNPEIQIAIQMFINGTEDARDLFMDLGEVQEDIIRDILGDPTYLPVTQNPTPLVQTGDLKESITTRVKRNV